MNIYAALGRAGVLGINRRNVEYTMRWNKRAFYPRVDDKLITKRLCQEAGIPVPRLLAVARFHGELSDLLPKLESWGTFVLKPAHGAMGNGVLVVMQREGRRFLAGGRWIGVDAFLYHAASIISGLYALGGQQDSALVEERLEIHPELAAIAVQGVPDIRVIIYRGIPVMSMTRLPTRRSRGRANLHQGALGAGIDLVTGRTTHAVMDNKPVARHPETDEPVIDVPIPDFDRALQIAVQATDQTGLGYVGADVVVDARLGPVILELNARPGLAIQSANSAGLLPRLREVDRCWRPELTLEQRVALGREIARSAGTQA